jgi:O-antigen ligase
VIAYKVSARAEGIFDAIWNIADWDSVVSLLLLIGGDRLQRTLVAYQALHDHPILGVGLGALKGFTDPHFRAGDSSLAEMSPMDFDTSLPATNVLLDLAGECGIIGLLAFL